MFLLGRDALTSPFPGGDCRQGNRLTEVKYVAQVTLFVEHPVSCSKAGCDKYFHRDSVPACVVGTVPLLGILFNIRFPFYAISHQLVLTPAHKSRRGEVPWWV